jgi:small-conductance mechanosensitive channel
MSCHGRTNHEPRIQPVRERRDLLAPCRAYLHRARGHLRDLQMVVPVTIIALTILGVSLLVGAIVTAVIAVLDRMQK